MATEEGKELALKSIAGAPDVVYPWPLTVGKGNCRGAEDEHDEDPAVEGVPVGEDQTRIPQSQEAGHHVAEEHDADHRGEAGVH